MRRSLSRFLVDQSGATAIEYALIAGGIALVIMTTVFNFGSALSAKYSDVSTALTKQNQ
jgi:pilus assembly protein Flp/PilA